jgi:diguanylate cyclase (GGDEF)-like protein
MSLLDGWRTGKAGHLVVRRIASPITWSLWRVPRPFLAYVLAVDAAAAVVMASTANLIPVQPRHLLSFGLLTTASVLHLEITRGVERLRELHAEGRIYVNLVSVWTLSALLVLPPALVGCFIALTYTHMWFRLGGKIVLHRWVFSACNLLLASAAGGAVLVAVRPEAYPALPHGAAGFALVIAATFVRWIVNRTIAIFALILMRAGIGTGHIFKLGPNDLMECGALGLGVLAASTISDPPYIVALLVVVVVVHRVLMLNEFSTARRDRVTGLHTAEFWHELAGSALQRAASREGTAGVLLIHLDRFTELTRRYGTHAAERTLRSVAKTLSGHVRKDDLLGRLPGDDFSILMPDMTATELKATAERIREAIDTATFEVEAADGAVPIEDLTVSVGGAIYPDNGTNLQQLLMVADNAVIAAQNDLGNQVRFPR